VNLILFEPGEIERPLRLVDPRAVHVTGVLKRKVGDSFDVGLINGPRGKAVVAAIENETLVLAFTWGASPPPLDPIELLIGLPRPQTARKILQEATALGARGIHFFSAEKSEASYAQSTLWSSGEWRRHLIAGAEQAFDTRLPPVTHGRPLSEVISALPPGGVRLALDNYEAARPLGSIGDINGFVILALGPERGWSAAERALLRASGFELVHLGTRVLRAETAAVAAVALVKAKLELM
jgi:16S rRNA (uracil1498-N3)-methyltransferase